MFITASVQLYDGDNDFKMTSTEAAQEILKALKGDPTKDGCQVTVIATPTPGTAGQPPAPPAMETPPVGTM